MTAVKENNEQRIIFVREAAIRLTAAYYSMGLSTEELKSIWVVAQKLWANKPEDCRFRT